MAKKAEVDWGDILNNIGQVKTGQFLFPKGPRTKLRLLQHPDDEQPFRVVQSEYRGQVREKYLLLGYKPDELELKGIILATTAFRSLVSYLAEDYDFFDPKEGHGIIVTRTDVGQRITYSIIVSKHPQEADEVVLESMGERNLDYYVKEWNEWQERKGAKQSQKSGAPQNSDNNNEEDEDPWS